MLFRGTNYTDIVNIKIFIVSNCTDGEIRLYGGRTELEGTVEICYGKVWGTINDDLVINDESDVICRQLGFSGEG